MFHDWCGKWFPIPTQKGVPVFFQSAATIRSVSFDCDDVINTAHVSRNRKVAGYRIERPLMDCESGEVGGEGRNPPASSSRFPGQEEFSFFYRLANALVTVLKSEYVALSSDVPGQYRVTAPLHPTDVVG